MDSYLSPAVHRVLKGRVAQVQFHRTAETLPGSRGVYMLWRDARLEYVGCSDDVNRRLTNAHLCYNGKKHTRIAFLPIACKINARRVERALIVHGRPKLNRTHNPIWLMARVDLARWSGAFIQNRRVEFCDQWTPAHFRRIRALRRQTQIEFCRTHRMSLAVLRAIERGETAHYDGLGRTAHEAASIRIDEELFSPYIILGPDASFITSDATTPKQSQTWRMENHKLEVAMEKGLSLERLHSAIESTRATLRAERDAAIQSRDDATCCSDRSLYVGQVLAFERALELLEL